jgi:putative transposase
MGLKVKELEECADTSELAVEWRMLRRGWYCGGDGFRDWLMERADAAVAGKKRSSFEAAGMRGHDEKEAGRLLDRALQLFEISMEDLRALRQSDVRKQAVAWWIKSRTVVGDAWICRELQMGNRVNVSRAVKRYRILRDAESRKCGKMFICTD